MRSCAGRAGVRAALVVALWLGGCATMEPTGARDERSVEGSPRGTAAPGKHESGRAGEAYRTDLLGREVNVEARDRSDVMAVALGVTLYTPSIGDTDYSPLGSFYYYGDWEARRLRAQVSGLVNDVEYAERLSGIEAIVRVTNDQSRLFGQAETLSGETRDDTELEWGRATLWLGAGYAFDLAPFNVDNQLRVQLYYRAEYDHFAGNGDTGADLVVPDDTWVHGPWLRLRLDGMQRNLLELPYEGYAVGADLELSRRDRWRSGSPGRDPFDPVTGPGDRDFPKLSGYAIVAGGVPLLSDRHRLRAQLYGGWAPDEALDRFSAFRIGGGPLPTEAGDLGRITYPGALFDQFIASDYVLARIGYQYELLFFLYLNAGISIFHGRIASFDDDTGAARFRSLGGESMSAGLTTGFVWQSSLQLEYDYDTRLARGGAGGHQVLALWSKEF